MKPSLIDDLAGRICHGVRVGDNIYLARPYDYCDGFWPRLHAAWLVLIGKADPVRFYKQNESGGRFQPRR